MIRPSIVVHPAQAPRAISLQAPVIHYFSPPDHMGSPSSAASSPRSPRRPRLEDDDTDVGPGKQSIVVQPDVVLKLELNQLRDATWTQTEALNQQDNDLTKLRAQVCMYGSFYCKVLIRE